MFTITYARCVAGKWKKKTVTKQNYADAHASIELMKSLGWELWTLHTGAEDKFKEVIIMDENSKIYIK